MKKLPVLLASLFLMSLLVACGGDGNGNGNGNGGGGPGADSFIQSVRDLISNNTSDTAEPVSLDQFPAPDLSDNTEPQPL